MNTDLDIDEMVLSPTPDPSPSTQSPKLKRLKKVVPNSSPNSPKPDDDPLFDTEESDGLDPLFSDSAKRVLQFSVPDSDSAFPWDDDKEICDSPKDSDIAKWKTTKKRKSRGGDKRVAKPKTAKRKESQERKAHLAQQAEFQRIMRERKCVGFKPVPMVEKPISSVLEKIRQRKLEVSRKIELRMMASQSVDEPAEETSQESDGEDVDSMVDTDSVADISIIQAPVNETSDDEPCSSREQSPSNNVLVEESERLFRAPVDDTQDLSSDSQTSDSQERPLNGEAGSPVEDVSPSLPSLNLRLDSALPEDISSDEEESDKENTEPLTKPSRKDKSDAVGDPVKEFLDEEALDDDSDDDLLRFEDKDEENEAHMEEHCDYIATDFNEKSIDCERRNQLHQTWLQQQDEAGTENLLQKLKYGAKQQEPSFLQVEDEDEVEDDGGSDDEEEDGPGENDTGNLPQKPPVRVTTKMLKQMIPLMFTDKDDDFVSSDDEETEKFLSKQHMLHKVELQRQTKYVSSAENHSSKEVISHIKKLNVVTEAKKKAKTSSVFESILASGSSTDSKKSSFLRRASSNPMPASHRQGPSTVKSYIFGRDDSRSSASIVEDSRDLNQTETQVKKVATAKFKGSQVKWCSQQTQSEGDKVSGTSLFEILKHSSVQTGHDAQETMVDHQAIFASFKSGKKQIKVNGRL